MKMILKENYLLVRLYSCLCILNDMQLLDCGLKRRYNFICQLVDTSNNEEEVRVRKFSSKRLTISKLGILLLNILCSIVRPHCRPFYCL